MTLQPCANKQTGEAVSQKERDTGSQEEGAVTLDGDQAAKEYRSQLTGEGKMASWAGEQQGWAAAGE